MKQYIFTQDFDTVTFIPVSQRATHNPKPVSFKKMKTVMGEMIKNEVSELPPYFVMLKSGDDVVRLDHTGVPANDIVQLVYDPTHNPDFKYVAPTELVFTKPYTAAYSRAAYTEGLPKEMWQGIKIKRTEFIQDFKVGDKIFGVPKGTDYSTIIDGEAIPIPAAVLKAVPEMSGELKEPKPDVEVPKEAQMPNLLTTQNIIIGILIVAVLWMFSKPDKAT